MKDDDKTMMYSLIIIYFKAIEDIYQLLHKIKYLVMCSCVGVQWYMYAMMHVDTFM